MPTDVAKTPRETLSKLTAEKWQIDRQIAVIQGALRAVNGAPAVGQEKDRAPKPGRRRMGVAERKAVARRMKAYWAKRKAGGKGKATAAK